MDFSAVIWSISIFKVDFPSPTFDIIYTAPQVDRSIIQQHNLETLENDMKGRLLDILHRDSSLGYAPLILLPDCLLQCKVQVNGLLSVLI